MKVRHFAVFLLVAAGMITSGCATSNADSKADALTIEEQGSFAVGGTMSSAPGTFDPRKPLEPAGQTYRGDHAYAFYQIPVKARKYPLVMLHGAGQFSKTWESTPDGREGFQNIFLRRGFSTYLLDQPRRGNAGRNMVEGTIKPTPDEQRGSTSSVSASGRTTSMAFSSLGTRAPLDQLLSLDDAQYRAVRRERRSPTASKLCTRMSYAALHAPYSNGYCITVLSDTRSA